MPLAASLVTFRLCAGLSWLDALYGMACVYAAQHVSFCLGTALVREFYRGDTEGFWVNWLSILLVGGICYVFIAFVLNYTARQINGFGQAADNSGVYRICLIYDMLSCLFVLWLQVEQRREVSLQSGIETEQYEFSRESIDIINQKCYDIKHQIAALRLVQDRSEQEVGLEEIERSVSIYDAVSKTGNDVLATVLTEKSLLCERSHISWTCMAQGELLNFMSPVDVYTLFGNALDNALEGSCTIPNTAQRSVAVTVLQRHGAAFIQIENYFSGPLVLQNGLPRTTKGDESNHGYGLKSIQRITERYGGIMNISSEDGIFMLSILIPIPVQAEAD